ncbi:CopG family ribbon-helix-helix protein [uncultured Maricaulis sp.]|uniref:CopG family ribbon-helix-helix protein n=1 Tax=uncultured Maricaulis sp. TaxID=174710 RepID=UPI0030DC5105
MRNISIRLDDKTREKLDALAQSQDRSRSWVVNDAIQAYFEHQDWIVEAIKVGIADADAGNFIEHEDLMAQLKARNLAARK